MFAIMLKYISLKRLLKKLIQDQNGGSMIESGLLIALSLILFLMLIAIVTDIYSWVEQKFQEVINFFEPLQ